MAGIGMADDRKNDAEQRRLQQVADGKKAMAAYEAEAAAVRAKTERLRALRLARDAANPPPVKAPPKPKSAKATKRAPKPLAEWLSDQKKDGLA